MAPMMWLLSAIVLCLAYANGANDTVKGAATLFGTGTADYRKTLSWATVTTLLGSLAALWAGSELLSAFRGKGLVPDALLADPRFLASVGFGAAATVLLATRLGFPISTTHALVGALVGAGLAAPRGEVHPAALWQSFLLPLLLSPFIAFTLSVLLYRLFRGARLRLGVDRETCLCVGEEVRVLACAPVAPMTAIPALTEARMTATVGTRVQCVQRYSGRVTGVDAQTALDALHYLSSGAVCFARGLNDTPKIAALLLLVQGMPGRTGIVGIALAMGLGGILKARRVAETMSHRIAGMNHGQGFTANLVSAVLVLFASRLGLPVSTTHVTCGALFGIGTVNRTARWPMIAGISLAWTVTLPLSALLAAAGMGILR